MTLAAQFSLDIASGKFISLREAWSAALALLLCVLPLRSIGADAKVTVSLERDSITLGESTRLIINYQNCAPTALPALPSVPHLLTQTEGSSKRLETVNNQTSETLSVFYTVLPDREGEFQLPPFSIPYNGHVAVSPPFKLRVRPREPLLRASQSGARDAFLLLLPPQKPVYKGETFPVGLELYVKNPSDLHLPDLQANGFTIKRPSNKEAQAAIKIGDAYYRILVFKFLVTPATTGRLSIGPASCDLVLRIRPPSSPGFGDPMFSEFFGNVRLVETNLVSDTAPVAVLPLPQENQPPGFDGAVGRFALNFSASPTNVTAGDPITLKLEISGEGALDALNYPAQKSWSDFQLYPPTSHVQLSDSGLSGVKDFEQVVIPTNTVSELPPLTFSYFDPEQGRYKTLRSPAIPLIVRPSPPEPLSPALAAARSRSAAAPPAQPDDIFHIQPFLGDAARIGPPWIEQRWFLTLQCLPLAALVSAWFFRRRQDRMAADPRLARWRQVHAAIAAGRRRLEHAARQNRPDEFFAVIFHLLQEQIGERLDLPSSSITEAVLDPLAGAGADAALLAKVRELFQLCNQARYAPENSARDLEALIPQVDAALRQLQGVGNGGRRR